jgi:amino acid transporter
MTPSFAVLIGFCSVLASVIAGLAGGLAGQNISQWYEQETKGDRREATISETLHSIITPNKAEQNLEVNLWLKNLGWVYVGLLSFFCSLAGNQLLQFLVCGNQDVRSCLPSPRLYTSVIAGFKIVLPIIFVLILIVNLLKMRSKRRNS